jgi:hypothetical protein
MQAKQDELFGKGGSPYHITWGMVFDAIKAGELVLKEGTETCTRPYMITDDIVWPQLEAKKQALNDYAEQLEKEAQQVYDRFVFNNVDGAVEALAAFAAG